MDTWPGSYSWLLTQAQPGIYRCISNADHTHEIQSDKILGWSEVAIDTNEAQAKYSQHLLNTVIF